MRGLGRSKTVLGAHGDGAVGGLEGDRDAGGDVGEGIIHVAVVRAGLEVDAAGRRQGQRDVGIVVGDVDRAGGRRSGGGGDVLIAGGNGQGSGKTADFNR